jgi:hypothetical protein
MVNSFTDADFIPTMDSEKQLIIHLIGDVPHVLGKQAYLLPGHQFAAKQDYGRVPRDEVQRDKAEPDRFRSIHGDPRVYPIKPRNMLNDYSDARNYPAVCLKGIWLCR